MQCALKECLNYCAKHAPYHGLLNSGFKILIFLTLPNFIRDKGVKKNLREKKWKGKQRQGAG